MAKAISVRSNQTTEREQVKYDIFQLLCERGIRTPQELDFFFREYLELNLPKKRICSNHLSPFEIICDVFFNQPPMSLWISSRGSGKTRTLANLDTIMLLTKPDYNIIHSAAIQAQTNQAYNYFLASHKYKGIKDMVNGDPTRDKTKFLNQSQISLITMTYQGTNCVTGDTLIEVPRDMKNTSKGIRIDLLEKYFTYSKKCNKKKPEIFAYAFDELNNKFTIKRIKDVFVTGIKEVWELKYKVRDLDDRRKFTTGTLRATPDHPIYVRGKGWTRLDALQLGDSLKAMGRKNLNYPFLVLSDEGFIPEHRFIGREHFGYDSTKEIIHHKDYNKYNNSIKNLEQLTIKEHAQLHSDEQRTIKYNGMWGKKHSPETKRKISIAMQGNDSWKSRESSLLYNHTVISVSPLGKKEKVYDMEVEGSFVANGIVVHNSPH